MAGDGLRGARTDTELAEQNPFSQWTADLSEPELWQETMDAESSPVATLIDGGKHYGHLEVNVRKLDGDHLAEIVLSPVYSFPAPDADGELTAGETERRVYDDEVRLLIGADGSPVAHTADG